MAAKPNISVSVDAPRIVVLYGADVLRRWDDAGEVWDSGVWDSQTGGLIPEVHLIQSPKTVLGVSSDKMYIEMVPDKIEISVNT